MNIFFALVLMVACVDVGGADDHVETTSLIRQWMKSLRNFEVFKANVVENRESYGDVEEPVEALFRPVDLTEDRVEFTGSRDSAGLPNGFGIVYLNSLAVRRSKVMPGILWQGFYSLEGNFTHGVANGAVRAKKIAGGRAVEGNVMHGVSVEISGSCHRYVRIRQVASGRELPARGIWLHKYSVIRFKRGSKTLLFHADFAECEPVVFDPDEDCQVRKAGEVKASLKGGFYEVTFEAGGCIHDQLQVPTHLSDLAVADREEVLAHLYFLQCEREHGTPRQSLVVDEELSKQESNDIDPGSETHYVCMKLTLMLNTYRVAQLP